MHDIFPSVNSLLSLSSNYTSLGKIFPDLAKERVVFFSSQTVWATWRNLGQVLKVLRSGYDLDGNQAKFD